MKWHHIFTLCLMFVLTSATQGAFKFTAWADNRPSISSDNRERFHWVISEMDRILGSDYAFHVVPGDYDERDLTGADLALYADVKSWNRIVGNHDAVDLGMDNYVINFDNTRLIYINEYQCPENSCECSEGRVCEHLRAWIRLQLVDAPPFVFVVGHEPAYPFNRHEGNSLDFFLADRDAFWQLLNDHGVLAYICGHTHVYSTYSNSMGSTVQIDVGNAGNPPFTASDPQTFVLFEATDAGYVSVTPYHGVKDQPFTAGASFQLSPPQGPPQAKLIAPADGGSDDLNPNNGEVTVNTLQPDFQIQLTDRDGINDDTVTSGAVSIGVLTLDTDYTFSYDSTYDIITLTSCAIDGFGNGTYPITLSGIADQADPVDVMADTTLTVQIDTSIVPPVTISFQYGGVDGYTGTVDTMLRGASADTSYAADAIITVDADDVSGWAAQGLLRFDDIIGGSLDQIPPNAIVNSATLRLRSTDDGDGGRLHAMVQSWTGTSTWNTLVDGIQADDQEASSAVDDSVGSNSPGDVDLDVTVTVQEWVDGTLTNNGWAILPNGTNGWDIASAQYSTEDYRPELIVTFMVGGDRPPVADAGPDQTVSDGDGDGVELVTLNGSGSYHPDPDAWITSYTWLVAGNQIEGTTADVSLAVGVHTVTLTVTDNEGVSDTDAVTITVQANQPPTANAGGNQTVADIDGDTYETITLNAQGSSDADGDIASYAWTVNDEPVLDPESDGIVTVTLSLGEYTAQLTVTDNGGGIATDTATLKVEVPTLFSDDFESGGFSAGGWTASAQATVETTSAYNGTYGVLLKKASSIQTTINAAGASAASLSYDARTEGLTKGNLYVEWSPDGVNWEPLETRTGTTNWAPSSHSVSLTSSTFMIRFRTDGSTGNDLAMVDNIVITATAGGSTNTPPEITSTAVTTATVGALYSYNVEAMDPDTGDTLTYSLSASPSGMTVNSSTGEIQWTPANDQLGDNLVTVVVEDTAGASDSQSFTVNVANTGTNTPPEITSTAVTTATVGALYSYNVEASDPDTGDTLTYSLSASPSGMTIDLETGLIQWTPTNDQLGDNSVTVQVSDGEASVEQTFTLTVSAASSTRVSVASISMSVTGVKKYKVEAHVKLDRGLDNATVVGDWYFKGVLRQSGVKGEFTPDTQGDYYKFISFETPAKTGDEFMFVVTNIIHETYTFAPNGNDTATIAVGP